MKEIPLYELNREDGGITLTPTASDTARVSRIRLIPAEDKALTRDGIHLYTIIDVNTVEGWYEVDAPAEWVRRSIKIINEEALK